MQAESLLALKVKAKAAKVVTLKYTAESITSHIEKPRFCSTGKGRLWNILIRGSDIMK